MLRCLASEGIVASTLSSIVSLFRFVSQSSAPASANPLRGEFSSFPKWRFSHFSDAAHIAVYIWPYTLVVTNLKPRRLQISECLFGPPFRNGSRFSAVYAFPLPLRPLSTSCVHPPTRSPVLVFISALHAWLRWLYQTPMGHGTVFVHPLGFCVTYL